jgi:hypothetical protein
MMSLIPRLNEEFGDGFEIRDGAFFRPGECADDEPEWNIDVSWGDVYGISFEIGWYKQEGEATGTDDLLKVMHAMEAASKAFNQYFIDDRRSNR